MTERADIDSPILYAITGSLPLHGDSRGILGILEFADRVPFTPVRLFWIADVRPGTMRGGHAHKACSQFMICTGGLVRIDAFDGCRERTFELNPGDYLHAPPRIFATETFIASGSSLLVLCDRSYEAEDYIHDRASLIPSER